MYIGCHMSIGKGFAKACEGAFKIGGETMQFFTRNPRGSKAKEIKEIDVKQYKEAIARNTFGPVVAHAPYILNLASPKDEMWELAQRIMIEDLERMGRLGVQYIALHPGSHVGKGVEYGIKRIASGLSKVLQESSSDTIILLETMAGSGTEVGSTFEEIKEIIDLVESDKELGVCFDTCHTFASGYDVDSDLDRVLKEFDEIIGLQKLKALHVNDSKNEKGSKKDRHANLGEGVMGVETFKKFVNHPKLQNLPLVLETPGGIDNYQREIALLREMREKKILKTKRE